MNQFCVRIFRRVILMFSLVLLFISAHAQARVALDNWFNHETDKNGKPYHYLWNDSAFSGYSQWGKLFAIRNAELLTISKPTSKVLSLADVYIIVDPDTTSENPSPNYILSDDILAISHWVKRGGVLVVLANDQPNCEFTHLNLLMAKFGMVFDPRTQHRVPNDNWDLGGFTVFPEHSVFKDVSKIYMKETSTIRLTNKTVKPLLVQNGMIYMAEARLGKGWVIAVCDPWIYNEYIDHARLPADFDNFRAAQNFTDYILSKVDKRQPFHK
jgi:unsaturated rhamnogalacturonyl hydrolase